MKDLFFDEIAGKYAGKIFCTIPLLGEAVCLVSIWLGHTEITLGVLVAAGWGLMFGLFWLAADSDVIPFFRWIDSEEAVHDETSGRLKRHGLVPQPGCWVWTGSAVLKYLDHQCGYH